MTNRFLLVSAILGLLVFGTVAPIWATIDFKAYLPTEGTPITPEFKFTKNIVIDYSNGGKLKNALMGKNMTIAFSDTSDKNTSIKLLMGTINTEFAVDRKTAATMSNLKLDYQVQIKGDNKDAAIDYQIVLTPTMTGYALNKESADQRAVLDMSWMGFTLKNPATITTSRYGDLEINQPLGVIKNQLPDVYTLLKGTAAETSLNFSLMDASGLVSCPIDQWSTLFDPSYTLSETTGYEYAGQKVAGTGFDNTQSDACQGSLKIPNTNVDFTTDSKYHLTVIDKRGSGIIFAEGHANGEMVQGTPTISSINQISPDSSVPIAQQQEIEKKTDDIISNYKVTINSKDDVKTLVYKGQGFYVGLKPLEAFQYFDTALKLDPKNTEAQQGKENAYKSLTNAVSQHLYDYKTLEKDPNNIKVLKENCRFYHTLGDYVDSLNYCERVLKTSPNAPGIMDIKYLSLLGLQKYEDAYQLIDKIDFSNVEIYSLNGYERTIPMYHLGKYDDVNQYLDAQIALNSAKGYSVNVTFLMLYKAAVLEKMGKMTEANSMISIVSPPFAEKPDMNIIKGYAFFKLQDYQMAVKYLEQSSQNSPSISSMKVISYYELENSNPLSSLSPSTNQDLSEVIKQFFYKLFNWK